MTGAENQRVDWDEVAGVHGEGSGLHLNSFGRHQKVLGRQNQISIS